MTITHVLMHWTNNTWSNSKSRDQLMSCDSGLNIDFITIPQFSKIIEFTIFEDFILRCELQEMQHQIKNSHEFRSFIALFCEFSQFRKITISQNHNLKKTHNFFTILLQHHKVGCVFPSLYCPMRDSDQITIDAPHFNTNNSWWRAPLVVWPPLY